MIVNRPRTFVCFNLWYGFTFYVQFFHSVTASTVFLLLADIEDVLPERSDSRSKSKCSRIDVRQWYGVLMYPTCKNRCTGILACLARKNPCGPKEEVVFFREQGLDVFTVPCHLFLLFFSFSVLGLVLSFRVFLLWFYRRFLFWFVPECYFLDLFV